MDIGYDPRKNKELTLRRGIGFEQIKEIFLKPHFVAPRGKEYPGQDFAVGKYKAQYWTVIFEDIEDEMGPLRWLITFWPSTSIEKRKYHGE